MSDEVAIARPRRRGFNTGRPKRTNEELIAIARKFPNKQRLREYSYLDYRLVHIRGIQDVAFAHMPQLAIGELRKPRTKRREAGE